MSACRLNTAPNVRPTLVWRHLTQLLEETTCEDDIHDVEFLVPDFNKLYQSLLFVAFSSRNFALIAAYKFAKLGMLIFCILCFDQTFFLRKRYRIELFHQR